MLNLPVGVSGYDDVARDDWFYSAITAAKKAGLFNGLALTGSAGAEELAGSIERIKTPHNSSIRVVGLFSGFSGVPGRGSILVVGS